MTKLQLADGSEYQLTTAGFYYADTNKRIVKFDILTNETLDQVIGKFEDSSKTKTIKVLIDNEEVITYEGYTELSDSYSVKKDTQGFENKITLSLSLPDVIVESADLNYAVSYASENMPDEDALLYRSLFDNWEDIPDGKEIKQGKRLNYNGGLWKCAKTHDKNADYWPGKDPTLFEQLDAEEHAGTIEDPIPVPDSVTTSGFTCIYGKYYIWNDAIYLCKRGGVENPEELYGQEVKLNYSPDALIDQYFVIAEKEEV